MNRTVDRCAARLAFAVMATIGIASGSGARAEDVSYQAETVQPAKRQGAVNAGNVAWQCDGNRCVGIGPWAVPPATLCAALAREVGAMRNFAQFTEREIAACNTAAAGPAPRVAPPRPRPPARTAPGSGQA